MKALMSTKVSFLLIVAALSFSLVARATEATVMPVEAATTADENMMDELDPFDPNIEQKLNEMDEYYEFHTGEKSHIGPDLGLFQNVPGSKCYRLTCSVYAMVDKDKQKLFLYVNGRLEAEWLVSTGTAGRRTPDFDTHPNGRIYDKYTSTRYPGGDYNGLGNMPYAVFISGGFAIHGTGQGNWKKLGTPASHGCIRVHPDNGLKFNRLVRQYGVRDTWITVN